MTDRHLRIGKVNMTSTTPTRPDKLRHRKIGSFAAIPVQEEQDKAFPIGSHFVLSGLF